MYLCYAFPSLFMYKQQYMSKDKQYYYYYYYYSNK